MADAKGGATKKVIRTPVINKLRILLSVADFAEPYQICFSWPL